MAWAELLNGSLRSDAPFLPNSGTLFTRWLTHALQATLLVACGTMHSNLERWRLTNAIDGYMMAVRSLPAWFWRPPVSFLVSMF